MDKLEDSIKRKDLHILISKDVMTKNPLVLIKMP